MRNVKIFFDPLPIKNTSNTIRILSKEVKDVNIRFEGHDPIIVNSDICVDGFCSRTLTEFYVNHNREPAIGRYIIHTVESNDWDTMKNAFINLYNILIGHTYDPNMLPLVIEKFISFSYGVKFNEMGFFSSADKLRDDELRCLKERVAKPDGATWLINFCKNLYESQDSQNSEINWLWRTPNIRFLHFIDDRCAQDIIRNVQIPFGSFILRISYGNPLHIGLTFKVENHIGQGLFKCHKKAKNDLTNNKALLYGVAAAPIMNYGTLRCCDKGSIINGLDIIKSINSTVGECINQSGSSLCNKKELTYEDFQELEELKMSTVNPNECRIFGKNITKGYKNQDNTFTIQTVNCKGKNMIEGGCVFEIGLSGDCYYAYITYIDNNNGTYTVTYRCKEKGIYRLSIRLMKQKNRTEPPYPDNHPGWGTHIQKKLFIIEIASEKESVYHETNTKLEKIMSKKIISNKDYDKLIRYQKIIYGPDSSIEATESDDDFVKHNIQCLLSMWYEEDIKPESCGYSELVTNKFGEAYGLSTEEPYYDQSVGAIGTSILVEPSIVCTASHYINEESLNKIRFVYGFMELSNGAVDTIINNNQIYYGKRILYQGEENGIVLIELDRPVKNEYNPTAVVCRPDRNTNEEISKNTGVYIIGHPCGLPMKIARHTKSIVTKVSNNTFMAKLNAFGGNSGSPVFNGKTHKIEGMLIGGGPDFVKINGVNRSLIIPKNASRYKGEICYDIANVYKILDTIPQYQQKKNAGLLNSLPTSQTPKYPSFIPADSPLGQLIRSPAYSSNRY